MGGRVGLWLGEWVCRNVDCIFRNGPLEIPVGVDSIVCGPQGVGLAPRLLLAEMPCVATHGTAPWAWKQALGVGRRANGVAEASVGRAHSALRVQCRFRGALASPRRYCTACVITKNNEKCLQAPPSLLPPLFWLLGIKL